MATYNKKIVYLSDAQRQELFANGSITVDGKTITYDPTDIYATPDGPSMSIGTVETLSPGSDATASISGTADNMTLNLGIPGALEPSDISSAVADWLDEHPEATTTVQDGSITKAKLDTNLQGTVDKVDEIDGLESRIDYSLYDTTDLTSLYTKTVYTGYILEPGTVVPFDKTSNSFAGIVVPCKKGDSFLLTGTGGSLPRLWGFTDIDYKALSWSGANAVATNLVLTASEDGYFISNVAFTGSNVYSLSATQIFAAASKKYADDLSARIDAVEGRDATYNLKPYINWVIGGITNTGGTNSWKYCIMPDGPWPCPVDGTISCDEGYQVRVVKFTRGGYSTANFISDSGWGTGPIEIKRGDNAAIQIRYANDSSTVLTDTGISQHIIYDFKADITNTGKKSCYYKGLYNINPANLNGRYSVINTDYAAHSFGLSTKYADIIALYDGLMTGAETGYITKNNLGAASGADVNDNTYNIYEYVFSPRKTWTYIASPALKHNPKILIDGGIHGSERNSVFALYCLAYDIVHNWADNPILAELRNNVELHIVPVVNPYGFDNNGRLNANDVDLNRNFPSNNWVLVPPSDGELNASGITGPLDQPETQAISKWILSNLNMLMYFNVHTNGESAVTNYEEANYNMIVRDSNDAYYEKLLNAFRRSIVNNTAQISEDYNLSIPYDRHVGQVNLADYYSDAEPRIGTAMQYVGAYLKAALSMTLELFNGLKNNGTTIIDVYSPESIKTCAEIVGNLIASVLLEYYNEF